MTSSTASKSTRQTSVSASVATGDSMETSPTQNIATTSTKWREISHWRMALGDIDLFSGWSRLRCEGRPVPCGPKVVHFIMGWRPPLELAPLLWVILDTPLLLFPLPLDSWFFFTVVVFWESSGSGTIEFSLNIFTEFGEFSGKKKNCFKKIAGLEPTSPRQKLYHCSTETQSTEKTVKLILIHASVDSLNSLNSANSAPFRENPNKSYRQVPSIEFFLFESEKKHLIQLDLIMRQKILKIERTFMRFEPTS